MLTTTVAIIAITITTATAKDATRINPTTPTNTTQKEPTKKAQRILPYTPPAQNNTPLTNKITRITPPNHPQTRRNLHLTVVPVRLSGHNPNTNEWIKNAPKVRQAWSQLGYDITWTIKPTVTTSHPCTDHNGLWDTVGNATRWRRESGTYLHLILPEEARNRCNAGMGEVGGQRTWTAATDFPSIAAHELGHNLGLWHANRLTCSTTTYSAPGTNGCRITPYGDYYDLMGASHPFHTTITAPWRDQLGLPGIQKVTKPGRYTLSDISNSSGWEPLGLRVERAGKTWWVDYQRSRDWWHYWDMTGGLQVRVPSPTTRDILLLDGSPTGDDGDKSASIRGRWVNVGNGVSMKLAGVSNGVATVDIRW